MPGGGQTDQQADGHTEIATFRLNQPRGWISETCGIKGCLCANLGQLDNLGKSLLN